MSDMNLTSVTVERFCKEIKEAIEDGMVYKPFLGLGKAGIGKTESIAQVAKELGIGFKEIRLVNHTETDMLGIPMLLDAVSNTQADSNAKKENLVTAFAQNNLLPVAARDGERGILVLDELTSASINMRTIAYQLLDKSRGVGEYKLPPGWLVVCLGNGMNDGGNFQGIEDTIFSRCLCFNVVPDLTVWKRWAVKNGTHASVLAFLSFDPNMLHSLTDDDEPGVICCPRSWTALSDVLLRKEKRLRGSGDSNAILDDIDISIYAGASVGEIAARKFMAFYKYNKQTINPEDILSGSEKGKVTEQLPTEVVHLVIQGVIAQLGKEVELAGPGLDADAANDFNNYKPLLTRFGNAINWAMDLEKNRMMDFSFMFIRELSASIPITEQIITNDIVTNKYCPNVDDFIARNGQVLAKA